MGSLDHAALLISPDRGVTIKEEKGYAGVLLVWNPLIMQGDDRRDSRMVVRVSQRVFLRLRNQYPHLHDEA